MRRSTCRIPLCAGRALPLEALDLLDAERLRVRPVEVATVPIYDPVQRLEGGKPRFPSQLLDGLAGVEAQHGGLVGMGPRVLDPPCFGGPGPREPLDQVLDRERVVLVRSEIPGAGVLCALAPQPLSESQIAAKAIQDELPR